MPAYVGRDVHLYIHSPTPIFKARANHPTAVTYPITSITFDDVTLGTYDLIEHDMTLVMGPTVDSDLYGRTRVQKIATSTSIPVARVSRGVEDGSLEIVDNAYITIYADDFRVWAKLPYQSPDGIDYKDGDVAVLDYLVDIPPVVIMGSGTAAYTSGGIITVSFDGSASYAMADGATIATYAWDIADGTLTVGTLTSAVITATFPAGFRYVGLTVTDSNDVPNTGRRPVLAVNPAADVTIPTAQVESQRFTQQGQTLRVKFPADLPRTTYLDGTLAMLWWGAPSSPSDRSHVKFIGYLQSEDAALHAQKQGLVRETTLEFVDVNGRLDSLPGFPQALQREDEDDVDEMWSLMPDLDINKALHYLAEWHSTAPRVADLSLAPTGAEYPSMRLDSTGATLYDQIHSRALSLTPDHLLVCNAQGQMSVMEDWMLIDVGDRPTVAAVLTEDDYSDLSFGYTRLGQHSAHVLRASAVVASTGWVMLGGVKTLPLAFSIAPGEAFSQGTSEATEAEGLTQSQSQLNVVTGHRYARLNARFGPVRVRLLNPTAIWDYVPALMNRIQLNIGAEYAAQRGLPFTTTQAMCKELSIRYVHGKTGLAIEADAVLELETSGPPAVTHVPETEGDPDDYETPAIPPPTVPPGMGLETGVQQVAGIGIDGYVYKTSDFQTVSGSGGPTWTRTNLTIAATIYSWVVDPFSPGYIDGVGAINGWIVNDTNIYRVTDLFGTPAKTSVLTFPVATSGASFHWRSIQASFGAFFGAGFNPALMCVSYYGSTAGHTGTWVTRSTDGGGTWEPEVQISAHYNNGAATRFNPIGVYASPKTPGLAYTAAYTTTASPALASGYVSTDWGATWAATTFVQPGEAFAGTIHVPWPSNADETLAYYGVLETDVVAGTADALMPMWGVMHEDNSLDLLGLGVSASWFVEAQEVGNQPGTVEDFAFLIMAPPKTAKRVVCSGVWSANKIRTGGTGNGSVDLDLETPTGGSRVDDLVFTQPSMPGGTSGSFTVTWTFTGADWPVNNESIVASPPATPAGARIKPYANANVSGSGGPWTVTTDVTISMTVTEIELDNGTIYTPVEASGGRSFKLKKTQGGVVSEISPSDGTRSYGTNKGHFGVRTFDDNRQYVVAGVMGNDTSGDAVDDKHAVYISDNHGATWAQVVAPMADTGAPTNRPAFEAAFGGDSQNILFIWGPPNYISYSSNFGVAVDSRAGNLSSFSLPGFIGIAGGIS